MMVSTRGLLAVFAAVCMALPMAAQPIDVKIKGISLGMSLDDAASILQADGYNVRIQSSTYKVAPDDPVKVGLFATRDSVGEYTDAITVRTSDHPTQARVAIINRRVIYQRDSGPIYGVYEEALTDLVGGEPAYQKLREIALSARAAHEIGYEWNAAGSFVTPSLLRRLAQTKVPLCVHATAKSRNNIVNLRQGHAAARPYRLDRNGRYSSSLPGTYAEGCHVALWATATVDDATQITQEFQQTFIDHAALEVDADALNIWLEQKQAETQGNLARDRGAPDL